MSHVATKWAFDQPELHPDMKPGEWAVLVTLADCHNPVNGCFPDQEYIARRTNLSQRSVRENLHRLRDRGIVTWEEAREDGHRASNRYRLGFEADFLPAESAGSPIGRIPHDQPAESDTTNRQNLPPHIEEPVREPVTEPEERERARDPGSSPGQAPASGPATGSRPGQGPALPDRAALEALIGRHPHVAHDSPPAIAAAWTGLTAAERAEAAARHGDWLADRGPRTAIAALSTYLREKRWTRLPPPKPAKAGPALALVQPWTRAWWRLYLDHCEVNRSLVGDPRSAASSLLRRHVSAARNRLPWDAGTGFDLAGLEERARHLVQVAIGSDAWRRWQTHWRARTGVDLPGPDAAPFAFLPSAEPPDDAPGLGLSTDDDVARLAGA